MSSTLETPNQLRYQYQLYLESDHWLELRAAVLSRDGHKCRRCPCRHRLQAHHLFYRRRWDDSVPEDLITLCRGCHERLHGIGKTVKPVDGVTGSKGNKRWNVHGDRVSRNGRPIKLGKKRKKKKKWLARVLWNARRRNWSF